MTIQERHTDPWATIKTCNAESWWSELDHPGADELRARLGRILQATRHAICNRDRELGAAIASDGSGRRLSEIAAATTVLHMLEEFVGSADPDAYRDYLAWKQRETPSIAERTCELTDRAHDARQLCGAHVTASAQMKEPSVETTCHQECAPVAYGPVPRSIAPARPDVCPCCCSECENVGGSFTCPDTYR